jgi:hypothetical protein
VLVPPLRPCSANLPSAGAYRAILSSISRLLRPAVRGWGKYQGDIRRRATWISTPCTTTRICSTSTTPPDGRGDGRSRRAAQHVPMATVTGAVGMRARSDLAYLRGNGGGAGCQNRRSWTSPRRGASVMCDLVQAPRSLISADAATSVIRNVYKRPNRRYTGSWRGSCSEGITTRI